MIRKDYTVFETTGHREETDGLLEALEPYGVIEFVRSARVAIINASSGFHEKLKEFEQTEPGEELMENEYLDKQDEVFQYVSRHGENCRYDSIVHRMTVKTTINYRNKI